MEREVTCTSCNHLQKTRSKLNRITCSNCGKKFPIDFETQNNIIGETNLQKDLHVEDNNAHEKTLIEKEELARVVLD